MSNPSFLFNENLGQFPENRSRQKISINFDKSNLNSNFSKRRAESANTNFTSNTHHNIFKQNKNIGNQSNLSENNSMFDDYSLPKHQSKKEYYKPKWKYSYYVNKNDILSLNNINNNSEIKSSLCDYKDIDKRPKPIVYSWTKPRMVRIIENNHEIEEEVKSHYWKYSHLFENNKTKPPGKLLRLIMTQLSQGGYSNYGGGLNNMNLNKNGLIGDDGNFNSKIFCNQQWKVPGVYKKNRNIYENTNIKRPKTAFHH